MDCLAWPDPVRLCYGGEDTRLGSGVLSADNFYAQ